MSKQQQVIRENDGYKKIEEILRSHHSSKFLLVCSRRDNPVKDYLISLNVEHAVYSDYQQNPLYRNAAEGVDLFKTEGCDFIIAIGGGSAIDVAKCIKLFCKMDESICYLDQTFTDTKIPLIVLPTTAGAGSEATKYAVIYKDDVKQTVTHESIIPDYVILEPSFLSTIPEYYKKSAMLDALCQAIESMWSVNSTNESMEYSKESIELILNGYKNYLDGDQEAARSIMNAANLSGRAINITQTTAAHAMSYKLTSLYRIAHGHAVALCLPYVWEYSLNHPEKITDTRGVSHLNSVFAQLNHLFGSDSTQDSILLFRKLVESLNLEIFQNDVSILAASVNPDRLKNNPVNPGADGITKMYTALLNEIIG
ncbi:MAG: phosphonoacetaldehyde reductase [Spirochaetes bacterium]|nr:phosphonoacetaldehyde reductase [Spirochaetota bacterium]